MRIALILVIALITAQAYVARAQHIESLSVSASGR